MRKRILTVMVLAPSMLVCLIVGEISISARATQSQKLNFERLAYEWQFQPSQCKNNE